MAARCTVEAAANSGSRDLEPDALAVAGGRDAPRLGDLIHDEEASTGRVVWAGMPGLHLVGTSVSYLDSNNAVPMQRHDQQFGVAVQHGVGREFGREQHRRLDR